MYKFSCVFVFFFSFTFSLALLGETSVKVPPLNQPVVDTAKLISASKARSLNSQLHALKQLSGDKFELAVLTLPQLGKVPIEQVSIDVVDTWKLGKADGDMGVLLLIAKKERKIRIEVGQGLEGQITDLYAKRIIDAMVPFFRSGRVDDGVQLAVIQLAQLALPDKDLTQIFSGKLNRTWKKKKSFGLKNIFVLIFMILFFIFHALSFFDRFTGGRAHGSSYRRRSHWGGGGFGGGSGGGFGGGFGGGGGFSGGGASGGW